MGLHAGGLCGTSVYSLGFRALQRLNDQMPRRRYCSIADTTVLNLSSSSTSLWYLRNSCAGCLEQARGQRLPAASAPPAKLAFLLAAAAASVTCPTYSLHYSSFFGLTALILRILQGNPQEGLQCRLQECPCIGVCMSTSAGHTELLQWQLIENVM